MSWSSDGYDAGTSHFHLSHSPVRIIFFVIKGGKCVSLQTSVSLATDYQGSARTSCLDRKRAGAGSDACLPGRH